MSRKDNLAFDHRLHIHERWLGMKDLNLNYTIRVGDNAHESNSLQEEILTLSYTR